MLMRAPLRTHARYLLPYADIWSLGMTMVTAHLPALLLLNGTCT